MDMDMVVFSGNSNRPVAIDICRYLDLPLGKAEVSCFADGETRVELHDNVRGKDVYIVQSICSPANHNIMEAVIMADACRRSSAGRITLVAPYFGYARQERKSAPRTPITAKLVADLIEASGYERVLTLELHTSAIQGFFNIPVDHLFVKPVFAPHFRNFGDSEHVVVVSPDAGGVERARAMAKLFECPLAIIDKRRERPNESSVLNIIGNVKDKRCLIVDDIVDTAGSLTKAATALMENGAKDVTAAVTHPVFSGPALDRIEQSCIREIIVTNSIPPREGQAAKTKKVKIVSIAEFLGKAMRRIHNEDSVSSLFI